MNCDKCGAEVEFKKLMTPWGEMGPFKVYQCNCEFEYGDEDNALKESCLPAEYHNMKRNSFGNYSWNTEILKEMDWYIEKIESKVKEGKGLAFFGNYGIGKTKALAYIAVKALEKRIDVKWIKYREMINILSGYWENDNNLIEYTYMLAKFSLLIIDDFALFEPPPKRKIYISDIFDERWENKRPVIFSSNINYDEFVKRMGGDLASRIKGMCKIIKSKGEDLREVFKY